MKPATSFSFYDQKKYFNKKNIAFYYLVNKIRLSNVVFDFRGKQVTHSGNWPYSCSVWIKKLQGHALAVEKLMKKSNHINLWQKSFLCSTISHSQKCNCHEIKMCVCHPVMDNLLPEQHKYKQVQSWQTQSCDKIPATCHLFSSRLHFAIFLYSNFAIDRQTY